MWSRIRNSGIRYLSATVAAASLTTLSPYIYSKHGAKQDATTWPVFRKDEVAKHRTAANRIWVTHEDKVYDVTDFVKQHPGGDKILLAAGGAVDSYWRIYTQHNSEQVRKVLAGLRVGTLHQDDVRVAVAAAASADDPYAKDPLRHPALVPRSVKPFNAEPPAQLLTDSFITPTDILFTRNHLPVPHIDEKSYRLNILREVVEDGKSQSKLLGSLTLEEIKAFPQVTITSALQCAGNRRGDMSSAKEAKGLLWAVGAMGNVEWTGVKLRDVLVSLGVSDSEINNTIKHIQFEGLDRDPATSTSYGASIPADRGMSPEADVLLAFELNGKPITRDHGFPLRVVVPGVTGARQVKWLGTITLSNVESSSLWQQKDYKAFPPYMDITSVDFDSMPPIQDMPVMSAICDPVEGSEVRVDKDGDLVVKGFAWSGGGRGIARVDVSADGGNTWHPTELQRPEDPTASKTKSWGWTLWTGVVPVAALAGGTGEAPTQLVCRAVDVSYNCQPESPLSIWNYRGLVNNAYHRVNVTAQKLE